MSWRPVEAITIINISCYRCAVSGAGPCVCVSPSFIASFYEYPVVRAPEWLRDTMVTGHGCWVLGAPPRLTSDHFHPACGAG